MCLPELVGGLRQQHARLRLKSRCRVHSGRCRFVGNLRLSYDGIGVTRQSEQPLVLVFQARDPGPRRVAPSQAGRLVFLFGDPKVLQPHQPRFGVPSSAWTTSRRRSSDGIFLALNNSDKRGCA